MRLTDGDLNAAGEYRREFVVDTHLACPWEN